MACQNAADACRLRGQQQRRALVVAQNKLQVESRFNGSARTPPARQRSQLASQELDQRAGSGRKRPRDLPASRGRVARLRRVARALCLRASRAALRLMMDRSI